ncbi:hypothetical protein [Turicimonas sp. TL08]
MAIVFSSGKNTSSIWCAPYFLTKDVDGKSHIVNEALMLANN